MAPKDHDRDDPRPDGASGEPERPTRPGGARPSRSPARRRVEALIYVQTCPEIKLPVAEGYRLAAEGEDPVAAVGGEAGWPLSWYWRATPTCNPTRKRSIVCWMVPATAKDEWPSWAP